MARAEARTRLPEVTTLGLPDVSLTGLVRVIQTNAALIMCFGDTEPEYPRVEFSGPKRNDRAIGQVATAVRLLDEVLPRSVTILPEADRSKSWRRTMETGGSVTSERLALDLPVIDTMGLIGQLESNAGLFNHSFNARGANAEMGSYVATAAQTLDHILPRDEISSDPTGITRWFDVIKAVAAGAMLKPGETDAVLFLVSPTN